ncbi:MULTISPECIES: serine/threonine protein kinase [unclassified Fusibacter]|uniref:protein kinase domain-containing protein n=1 Tax=unclassified Fusibacter TaxID=2624464 RepID=UPI001010DC7E|nr:MULTISPECIES: serine/threonine protein kinase [unclassified Fusibacter]MCK8061363.1 hypothetical protein [Fusibacter sp. A2]NPE23594.1 serine/threonine protein kinase [Fusibacter sp. A1]RXV59003.1 serine/threonine protein kinase [Fusibacter sp. A1]
MKALLSRGQRITGAKQTYRVGAFLGSGGQGEVYEAIGPTKSYAIKWYFGPMATPEQKRILEKLVAIGPPNNRFLWPLEIVTSPSVKGFGYIMPIRSKRYKSIVDLMKRKAEPSFYTLIISAIQMVDCFDRLHKKGLCYRDISFGNVFFDDRTGDVLICDNDNITSEKEPNKSVLGTPRFMAPEIVRGDKMPDIKTDLFSLSVLLFYMFMIHHPLEGKLEASIKCFDLPAMKRLYGDRPVFIYDPIMRSNRPVEGLHDNAIAFWKVYPEFFKDAFTQNFTKGLRNRDSRLLEEQWLKLLIRLKNGLMFCTCGAENFYDHTHLSTSGLAKECWACGKKLELPARMRVGSAVVMLNFNTKLYAHQLIEKQEIDFKHILGMVTKHPTQVGVWGLKNMSSDTWQVTTKTGRLQSVPHGKSCTLDDGIQIQMGQISAQIKR